GAARGDLAVDLSGAPAVDGPLRFRARSARRSAHHAAQGADRRTPRRASRLACTSAEIRMSVRVGTVTASDTRTLENDEGGRLLGELCQAAGFEVVTHSIVREEPEALRGAALGLLARPDVDAVIVTGGTGVAPRDRTLEAIEPLF